MKVFACLICLVFSNLAFSQCPYRIEYSTEVDTNSLSVYLQSYYMSGSGQILTDCIGSYNITSQSNSLELDVYYDLPTTVGPGTGEACYDTLLIDSNTVGNNQLIINAYMLWDNLAGGTDTIYCESDTSYFQILSNFKYSLNPTVQFYPNPAKNTVYFTGLDGNGEVLIELFDHIGRLVRQQKIDINNPEIFVSDLPSGIYTVNLKLEEGTIVRQLIIEGHD